MSANVNKTALYDLHMALGARMVPFAGYEMPVQYPEGIKYEHEHTRVAAGLFDVSHMCQIHIYGNNAGSALERLVTGNISSLKDYRQRYTLLTNEQGGIKDDLMVTKIPEGLFVVVNAACKDSDYQYIKASLEPEFSVEMLDNKSLLALQGPKAAEVLCRLNSDIGQLSFLAAGQFEIENIPCFVNRCGYTGEDGFEISVESVHAEQLTTLLLSDKDVAPVGLGARDSLRLEAGLCLYGHDIDQQTTPVEADLSWTIAKKYRDGSEKAMFPGAEKILAQVAEGTERLRVGLLPEGKMPIREGAAILNDNKQEIGLVTSGGFGPTISRPVAMGYVKKDYAKPGTELQVEIRNRFQAVRVKELPFVEHQYYKS